MVLLDIARHIQGHRQYYGIRPGRQLSNFGRREFERDVETLASAHKQLYCTRVFISALRLQVGYDTVSCLAHVQERTRCALIIV